MIFREWKNFIRCTTLLPPFYLKIWGFIHKKVLPIYDLKYFPSLATTFFHHSCNCRIPSRKSDVSFEAIHDQSIFWLLHKSGNADEPSRVPSIKLFSMITPQVLAVQTLISPISDWLFRYYSRYPVQKLPNLVRVCDEGPMRLATWGRNEENCTLLMRAREG